MKTIEERAFELYPDNPWCRHAFLRGCMFERNNSVKDIPLTWEDMMLLRTLFDAADANQAMGALTVQPMTREYYEYLLQEFNKLKTK